jgi:hypothetical protein
MWQVWGGKEICQSSMKCLAEQERLPLLPIRRCDTRFTPDAFEAMRSWIFLKTPSDEAFTLHAKASSDNLESMELLEDI